MAGKMSFTGKKLPLVKVLCSFVFLLDTGTLRFEILLDMLECSVVCGLVFSFFYVSRKIFYC